MLRRWAGWVSGVWGGLLLGVGFIGAPAGFAVTTAEVAGRSAGRMFAVEAYVSLAVAVIVLILTRRSAGVEPDQPVAPALNTDVLLVLGTLFCTVAGYFVIQPMMAAARAGQGGGLSFGALHGLSAGFFALKALLVLLLAWRLAAR
ncbi:MAG TPA: DUF4149 domain-containing protein [Burkholderiaceae bacterium]|nr:DUF4149 domain-containing protein [Burkholderiaceae bacterium]